MSNHSHIHANPPARTHAEAAALFRRPFAPGAIGFRAMTKVPYRGEPYAGAQVAAYIGAQSVDLSRQQSAHIVDRIAAATLVGAAVLKDRRDVEAARVRERVLDSLLGRPERKLLVDDPAELRERRSDLLDEEPYGVVRRRRGEQGGQLLAALVVAEQEIAQPQSPVETRPGSCCGASQAGPAPWNT